MNTPLSIVTGASRGLGRAVAEQLLARGHQVLSISRTSPDGLSSPLLQHWTADLADARVVAARLATWLAERGPETFGALNLINNAGVISHLAPLGAIESADLANALRVGLEAPMLLTAAFLRATQTWTVSRKVVLVSSGLGRRAMAGAALYCAAKAGLDNFSRSVALDEARHPHGARIVALAPGVIDTAMQSDLRAGDPDRFPDRAGFVQLQQNSMLASPEHAAARVLAFLAREDFGSQALADVRDA